MFIAEMKIKKGEAPPFSEPVKFEFDKRVNVFIGPNASGKSTALEQVLNNFRREWAGSGRPDMSGLARTYIDNQPVSTVSSEHCVFALEDHDADNLRTLRHDAIIVPAIRVRYGQSPEKEGPITDTEMHDLFGVESLSSVFYQDYIHTTVSALQRIIQGNPVEHDDMPGDRRFADHELLSALVVDAAETDRQQAASGLLAALSAAHKCAEDICREIVLGDAPFGETVIRHAQSGSGLPDVEAHIELGLRIQTSDTERGRRVHPLNVAALSAGTEGTLWWTRLIALSLLFMHEFNQGWRERRAYLLIDEIENHLHPTWQRRVIPALLDHFPGLQIFATTHSPFVVAGLKAGQVHLLNRDENGVVTATTNTEDIVGWTADEILRTMMGVADPTDDETARNAAELRRLRDAGTQNTPEEEERRQEEMQRLRRSVNRDLLAGGPREAQRELFEQQFGEALEKYLQS